ncbi:MAG TPA: MBL fold metallo-hydrolase [Woeseiaceae bacterium]|nr:MBL fold metallo-hydrolase [Woeseiaceae bacterium]
MKPALQPGRPVEVATGVTRLVAPNPGMMTGPGTNTYLLGREELAIIDPGPAIADHVSAILRRAGGRLRWVLVTHTHTDHSPAAQALVEATGATLLGRPAPGGRHQDGAFRPERVLVDGDVLTTPEFALEVLHTPGHASNHLCYRHTQLRWLFTGDHIIDGSTVVIDPPDGNMGDYLRSLERLKRLDIVAIAPGHGDVMDRPREVIDWLIAHRLQREAKVERVLAAAPGAALPDLVRDAYDDVDASLHPVAERSLLAHLEKLEAESRARREHDRWYPAL